jgi:diketogulonate reductase-like aldo/keto reductase
VSVIPIIGARKLSQLQDNLASFNLALLAEQVKALDEASQIDPDSHITFMSKSMSVRWCTAACETKSWLDCPC